VIIHFQFISVFIVSHFSVLLFLIPAFSPYKEVPLFCSKCARQFWLSLYIPHIIVVQWVRLLDLLPFVLSQLNG